MDVFALRSTLVDGYAAFARSFTRIRADDLRHQVDSAYADGRFWPEPLIQINPRFKPGHDIAALVAGGVLHPRCAEIFAIDGATLRLHAHQEHAIALAANGQSYVVTTGTGSGKSLCFFVPIVDALLRERDPAAPRRTRAIVIYPMNALANSQEEEIRIRFGQRCGATHGAPGKAIKRLAALSTEGRSSTTTVVAIINKPGEVFPIIKKPGEVFPSGAGQAVFAAACPRTRTHRKRYGRLLSRHGRR